MKEKPKQYELLETTEGIGIILVQMLDIAMQDKINQLKADLASRADEFEEVRDYEKWIRENT